jgi:hypothetical protein
LTGSYAAIEVRVEIEIIVRGAFGFTIHRLVSAKVKVHVGGELALTDEWSVARSVLELS